MAEEGKEAQKTTQNKIKEKKKIKSWKEEYLRKESPETATTREEMGTQTIKHYTNISAREGFGPWS